jgi:hypothetical protein
MRVILFVFAAGAILAAYFIADMSDMVADESPPGRTASQFVGTSDAVSEPDPPAAPSGVICTAAAADPDC